MGAITNRGEKPLPFERLLIDLSTPFINVTADQIDSKIEATQKTLCDSLGLDYSALAQWDEATGLLVITHSWVADGKVSGQRFAQQDIAWLATTISRGEAIRADHRFLPGEAAREVAGFFPRGIQSSIFLPLKASDKILGFLCFGTSRSEREWPDDFDERLSVIADVFANSLVRSRLDDALVQSHERRTLEANERFRVAIESFPTAVILANSEGRIVLTNSRTAVAFGYTQDELFDRPIEMLIPQRFRGSHGANRAKFAAHPSARAMGTGQELYGLRRDGSEFQVDVALTPIQGDGDMLVLSAIADVTDRKLSEKTLSDLNARLLEANEQIRKLKEQLERDRVADKREIRLESNHVEIVGRSQAILRVLMSAEQVAPTDSTVLLLGETGSGKELVARAIHKSSKRNTRPMVTVNCAALPASLVENELFGRERGAYTGALTREIGRFELADRSTIFLDEIGELPLELQAKLLRVLQEGEFERLGSSKTLHVDVRLIAATSRDLEGAVREGKFREDLFYRLNVFPIRVPPLRERREDIPMLTWHFLQLLGGRMGRDVETVRATTMKAFQAYRWPGNVRELRNVIERNLIVHQGTVFEAELPEGAGTSSVAGTTIEEVDRDHIFRTLERTGWRVRGPGGAAEALGLKPTTLEARMKKLGIVRK